MIHKPKGIIQRLGPFFALLELRASGKKRNADADNKWKSSLDYAAKVGLIENDKHMQWGAVGWVDDPDQVPYGAKLTLIGCEKGAGLSDFLTALRG